MQKSLHYLVFYSVKLNSLNISEKAIRTLRLQLLVGITGYLLTVVELQGQSYAIRVAPDGSGDHTSVQAAINAAPHDLSEPYVIFIANGVYDEQLYIEKNFITLIGESRDSTILTSAILRRVWREEHRDDWGAATINISPDATDLTIAHLTVRNNFAEVFPDFPGKNDHTFAIRGGGHRVIIVDCNIVATGGDTLSLWNTEGGMYYHRDCYFEGYVDYVCPRGYCYIENSTFFGHNMTASIWHDGSGGEDHKLVIRNSTFDGVENFALGRHHREAAFYLLDCVFKASMQDREIYDTQTNTLRWGSRVYYYNCHSPALQSSWFADNLQHAPGNPDPAVIDARWTFGGKWDPEVVLEALGL
jgi:pectinesterase